jgi:homocysteine S-methyltransferase
MVPEISYPIILDGGLSNVLEKFGCDLNHRLWTARLIQTNPELIVKAHIAYLEAGATCITSSGYQATIEGFMQLGENKLQARKLLLRSVELALQARHLFALRNDVSSPIYVAASMGPYGAFLADGSEYQGNYKISEEQLRLFHASRIDLLSSSDADFFAFETIPSFIEVKVLASLLKATSKPSWISFSCKNELSLNDGSTISEAAKIIANHPAVFAIGVNCTAPKYISKIIQTLKITAPDKKIIVYPNSGEVYHSKSKSWFGMSDPAAFEKMAQEWNEIGADIIGGCCRVGPEYIDKIRYLKNKKN